MVQDHERLLWEERNIAALAAAKCPVVDNYPKCSPDLNAIENAWHRVRQHLEAHAPEAMETRPEFLLRLRRTVNDLNSSCQEELLALCTNQHKRAQEVKKMKGAKCHY